MEKQLGRFEKRPLSAMIETRAALRKEMLENIRLNDLFYGAQRMRFKRIRYLDDIPFIKNENPPMTTAHFPDNAAYLLALSRPLINANIRRTIEA